MRDILYVWPYLSSDQNHLGKYHPYLATEMLTRCGSFHDISLSLLLCDIPLILMTLEHVIILI